MNFTHQVIGFLSGVVTKLAGFVVPGACDKLPELVHEMPSHVITVLILCERDITDRALRTNVNLLRFVHHNLTFLSYKLFILKQRVETRVTKGHVLR